MPKYEFEKDKLDALLAEVNGELDQILASNKAALAKAATDDEPAEESSGSGDGAPADDLAPEASASAPEASPEASIPEESAPAEASAPVDGAPEASAEAPPSLEELVAAYSQLPPEQLAMHKQAADAAAAQLGLGGPDAGGAPVDPAAAAGPPAADAAPMAPPAPAAAPPVDPLMGKAEKAAVVASPKGNGGQVRKSEKDIEIEALKAQLADQGAALAKLVDALETPMRKSVKGISEVQYIDKAGTQGRKAADLSKSELTKLLREKARDASLSKSDRALIVAYSTGRVSVDKLEHLLASAK